MDMITLALAKGYTDSKQIASVETTLTKVLEKEDGFHFDDYTPFVNVGTKCIVKFCGETYERTAFDEGDGAVGVGNPHLNSQYGVDTGEPFYISMSSGATFIFYQTGYTGVIELYVKTEIIHTIDPKYLPAGIGGDNTIRFAEDYGSVGALLNEKILELAMGGGGVFSAGQDCEALWADIVAKQPTQMVLNTGIDVRIGVDILCAGETIPSDNWFISGSGAMAYFGVNLKITCILSATNGGSGVVVSVLAEPLTFPE